MQVDFRFRCRDDCRVRVADWSRVEDSPGVGIWHAVCACGRAWTVQVEEPEPG